MNNEKIFLSIVIPIYNVLDYVDDCIDSILSQCTSDIEIIAVNDGSTDGTDIFLNEKYSQIECITIINRNNGGISAARNSGISIAKGKYITVLDGDDKLKKGSLSKIISCLKKNNPDVLMTDYIKAWADGGMYFHESTLKINKNTILDSHENSILSDIYDGSELYAWRFIVKNEIYQNSLYHEGYVFEDIRNIPIILSKAETFFYLPLISVIYNQRPNSTMKTKSLKNILDLSSSTAFSYEKISKMNISEKTKISHTIFSMKVYIWSIQDLIIAKQSPLYTNDILDNYKKSIFNNESKALDKLKKIDRKNYILFKLLSKKKILKVAIYMYNEILIAKKIMKKIYNKL